MTFAAAPLVLPTFCLGGKRLASLRFASLRFASLRLVRQSFRDASDLLRLVWRMLRWGPHPLKDEQPSELGALQVRGNGVGDVGATALAEALSKHRHKLLRLDLGDNVIGDTGVRDLLATHRCGVCCWSVCLSVCLSACPPACLPAYLPTCLSVCLSVCRSVCFCSAAVLLCTWCGVP